MPSPSSLLVASLLAATASGFVIAPNGGSQSSTTTALNAKQTIGVADVLANPKWPDDFPFSAADLRRQDEMDDSMFYSVPRFCYHIDERAVAALTSYYAREFPKIAAQLERDEKPPPAVERDEKPSPAVLDMLDICASHVSHYPKVRIIPMC